MAWNEIENTGNGNGNSEKAEYTKFPVGTTTIRVLDEQPITRWTHWIPQANGGKGLSVKCTGKGCPICAEMAKDKKAKVKSKYSSSKSHAINVLNRSTNRVEIMDKGNKIFGGLLVILNQMGDLRNYDVNITRTGEGLGNINYTVLPTFPPKPLTPEELALPKYDLADMTKAFTNEQILMLMSGATIEQVNADNNTNQEPQEEPSRPDRNTVSYGNATQEGTIDFTA